MAYGEVWKLGFLFNMDADVPTRNRRNLLYNVEIRARHVHMFLVDDLLWFEECWGIRARRLVWMRMKMSPRI